MKVSVLIITYNHAKYIAQAIESVLMQKVNFDYEIVIGDDCSTDGAPQIIQKFADKHSQIKALLRPYNLGLRGKINFMDALSICQGEYIAMLDGDDYWIDPNKLQKQVDFLDFNPDFSICFTNANYEVDNGLIDKNKAETLCASNQKEITTILDLFYKNYIPACTVLFKNKLSRSLPKEFVNCKAGDWMLHILNAQFGRIKYFQDITGVYRVHGGGVWSANNVAKRALDSLELYKDIEKIFSTNKEYLAHIKKGKSECYHQLVKWYAFTEQSKTKAFINSIKKILTDTEVSIFDFKSHITYFKQYVM
jgi:glycosyltransferase involved in cell wall biosynthesis